MLCSKECLAVAAIGGLLPTTARLATVYTITPSTPLPEIGMYFGLLLFAAIGAAQAFGLAENNLKQALLIGVCAPGIITNMVAGAQEAKLRPGASALSYLEFIIPSSHAQTPVQASGAATPKSDSSLKGSATPKPAVELPSYQITIDPTLNTTDEWTKEVTWGRLIFVNKENISVNEFPFAMNGKAGYTIPLSATAAYVYIGNKVTKLGVPQGSNAVLDIRATSANKNDFLWALGARRQPVITEFSANIQSIK